MAKVPNNSTPNLLSLVEWIPHVEAVKDVVAYAARSGAVDGISFTVSELARLKREVVDGNIQSIGRLDLVRGEIKLLTPEDRKRLDDAGVFDSKSRCAAHCISLRRYQFYFLWPYSDRQRRESWPEEYGGPEPTFRNEFRVGNRQVEAALCGRQKGGVRERDGRSPGRLAA
jgi:hypothetical protein